MGNASTTQVTEAQFLDPRWRLCNLYSITDKAGRKVPFRPNAAQLQFLDELHSLNIILKARQLGFTTLCCLIYLDACIFTPNTRAALIAHKLDDAKVIFRDKVKFPYDSLDEGLRAQCGAVQDSADTLTFSNNSSLRVSTSTRSGTLQYLHVSEFGKICAQFPEKAREIVTGALNTVEAGQFVVIESTAEGQDGQFYRMFQEAQRLKAAGQQVTPLDYRAHFFPWWQDKSYQLPDAAMVPIGDEYAHYFDRLEEKGIVLTPGQKAWYVRKDQTMEGDMKREFPSTPEEAFEQALEGAYFSRQLAIATKHRRIGGFPFDPRYPVNTFWDLGRNDLNTIWKHQYIGGFHRFIGYYENSGEHISHYIKHLRDWAEEVGAVLGEHYLPHDGNRESLWLENGTRGVLESLRFRPSFVARPAAKVESIEAARAIFPRCQFDESSCSVGLKHLRMYRKQWDDLRGVWKDTPLHDDASHGADAFQTFACSGITEVETYVKSKPVDRYRRSPSGGGSAWAA